MNLSAAIKKNKLLSGICILILVLCLMFWLLPSHDDFEPPQDQEKIKVAATIFPLFDIVRQVGGDKIDAILILPPGSSPHTFEASPAQIKKLQGTKYFFTIGSGVDAWAQNIANAVSGTEIMNLDEYIPLQPFKYQNEEDGADNREHEGLDPHYWLNPDNAKIMARQISDRLKALAPQDSDYYEIRYQNFIGRLDAKDAEWKNKISRLEKKDIVVFHDAWGYFADYFALNIVASFESFPGKTPGPQYLINLQKKIKEHDISALFVEPQLSKDAITTLAHDLKVDINILDPLGGSGQRNSYIDLIDYNINNIYDALK